MSIIKVNPSDIESFSVVTNPFRTYSTSSSGAEGSVYVFARRSDIEKETAPLPAFIDATYTDEDLSAYIQTLQSEGRLARHYAENYPAYEATYNSKFNKLVQTYLEKVNAQKSSVRKQKVLNIIRFTPSTNFTSNTVRKLIIKDILNPYYQVSYPTAQWAYTNYNTLNFFTSSTVPTSSVLLYPNVEGSSSIKHEGYVSGTYSLSGAFSFDFYINPRYQQSVIDGNFHAGTILHLSSSYALSLVSGSAKDANGKAIGFRLQLQLSHSADISPSVASLGSHPSNLVFLSDDNSLKLNNWHHVVVRWGTNTINKGTGSFNIDGVDRGYFVVPSGTITPRIFDNSGAPDVLCVGNYWQGNNQTSSTQASFFAEDPSTRDGLEVLLNSTGIEEPLSYKFDHPLNAELHDLCIKRYYMTDVDIEVSSSQGISEIDDRIAFYVPPFFTEKSPFRKSVGNTGGILQTPFFEIDGSTNDPFNTALSFGVNGHYINIENYVRDFANDTYPRLHHMSGSAISDTTQALPANEHLYKDPFIRRRNLFILPCDDGSFVPNYNLLAIESNRSKFTVDDGFEELSYVNLNNLLSTGSLIFGTSFDSVEGESTISAEDFIDESIGFTPENPEIAAGPAFNNYKRKVDSDVASGIYDPGIQTEAPLTIYQRTKDPSSNQVTFFDISNLYYGKRILPGSFMITDDHLSGSGNAVKITLKDDGYGNIYRADCLTSASTWNSCGNIYYNEGIVVIKNPHLYFYGKEGYEVSFRGEQNIHALKLEVIAPQNMLNSSSNPGFKALPASGYKTDTDPNYVYITGINFHDENLNVVAKTQLAQPILKRHGDRILFKATIDF
jgi:hypothetical protein